MKRKLPCCAVNKKKRQKLTVKCKWKCDHCKCAFPKEKEREDHVNSVHRCKKCQEILLSIEELLRHQEEHKREEEKEEELIRRKEELNNGFVVDFVIPKKLDEFKLDPDQELDFDYIFRKHSKHIGQAELLHFVTQLGLYIEDLCDEAIHGADVVYLLEKNAITEQTAAVWLNSHSNLGFYGTCKELLEYFLDQDFAIEPAWIVWHINNNELMGRIKAKCEFTFNEIYGACNQFKHCSGRQLDRFYVIIHRHFPDPNFEDPFEEEDKNPFEEEVQDPFEEEDPFADEVQDPFDEEDPFEEKDPFEGKEKDPFECEEKDPFEEEDTFGKEEQDPFEDY